MNQAIRLNPKDAEAYFDRGEARRLKKDYDAAIVNFDRASRLRPRFSGALASRGAARSDMQQYDRAIADYDESIRVDPNYAWPHNARGWLLQWKLADEDQALTDYDEAIRLDPKRAYAYVNRGILRRNRAEWAKALADLDEAIRLEPRNDDAHYHRGVVRFASRRDGAADDARAVLDIQGWRGNLSLYAVLNGYFADRRAGRPDRARSLLDEAATKCDASAWPYPIIRHLRGELDEAGLLAAAGDDGKRVEARCYLGLEALEDGRSDAALEHFRWVKERGNPRFTQCALSVAELGRLLAKGAEGDGP